MHQRRYSTRMSARDFIESELLPWIQSELADDPAGNKHYLAGFNGAVAAMQKFIEQHRPQWDIEG
jgi:hypothetical protein